MLLNTDKRMHHGHTIKEAIRIKAITQDEFAKMMGVSRNYLITIFEKAEWADKYLNKAQSILKIDLRKVGQKASPVMEPSGTYKLQKPIPYYDIDVSAGNIEMFQNNPEVSTQEISVPGFEDCDFGVPVYGDSMYPTYKNGFIVVCKRITDLEIIQYGECYLVVTAEQRMVKRLQKSTKKDCLLAVSDNSDSNGSGIRKYEPFDIPKAKIKYLFIIKGSVSRSQL